MPLESRGQESSIFGVVDEEDNIGDDMSKLVVVVATGYFLASTFSLHRNYQSRRAQLTL
jgi:hypothetical protein